MKARSLLLPTVLVILGFVAGHIATVTGLLGAHSEPQEQSNNNSSSAVKINSEQKKPAWLNMEKSLVSKVPESLSQDSINTNDELEEQETLIESEGVDGLSEAYAWKNPDDIIAMFDELIILSDATTDEEIREFSIAIDQLRDALSNSPTQMAILLEHMQGLKVDSKGFLYITAILQGLPNEIGKAALQNAALQISQRGDLQSQKQFLHLVSSNYDNEDNPEVLSALVNIALYSESPSEIKLEALDLVMPFQVSDVEKQQIRSQITTMLDAAQANEKGPLLNHALRFSSIEEREQMANRFIDSQNDIELRYSILDGLHSGTVPRTQQMKEQLFSIAQNPSDPLNQQAKHALMYVFDISNQEYRLLKQ